VHLTSDRPCRLNAGSRAPSPHSPPCPFPQYMFDMEGGVLSCPDPNVVLTHASVTALTSMCASRRIHLRHHPTVVNVTKLIVSYNAELLRGGIYALKTLLRHSM